MVNSQMKQDGILAQKNFTFAAFFMPFYLAFSNNCVNTHIRATALLYFKNARVIYNINTRKKRCARSFS